ncbi:MAG: hypothetical protein WCR92_06375 [Candidatus Cloacimonadaceae bacterium]|jgi:hypothetical protein
MPDNELKLFRCEALNARISLRQCRINQEEARRRAALDKSERFARSGNLYAGWLHVCLACTQKDDLDGQSCEAVNAGRDSGVHPAEKERENIPENMPAKYARKYSRKYSSDDGRQREQPPRATPGEKEKTVMEMVAVTSGPKHPCPRHPDQEQMVCMKPGTYFGKLMGRCRICMQERAREGRKTRKENRLKGLTKPKAKPAAAPERVLVLNFAGLPDEGLWDNLHQQAREELRPPEMQALHLIRSQLRASRKTVIDLIE